MGRGKKKADVSTREPEHEPIIRDGNTKRDDATSRVSPVSAMAQLSDASGDARQKEPVYRVVKGALSTLSGIIDSETVVEVGNKPGQIKPQYVPGGMATIQGWIGVGVIEEE